jgi:predicted amidohydrolase
VPGPPVWIDAVLPGEDGEWHVRLQDNAVAVPSIATDRLGAAARQAGVVLVVGVNEREEPNGGTVYNTVLTFGPDGELLGRHRKLVPTHAERLVWGMGDGSDLVVLDSPAGRLASLICWENYMPLARFQLYNQGPEIWLAPTLATHEPWVASMRHIAREAACYVVGVAPVMHVDWLADDLPDAGPLRELAAEEEGWLLDGYSVIVDPQGDVLAGPLVRERAPTSSASRSTTGRSRRWSVGSQVSDGQAEPRCQAVGDQGAVAGLGIALHAEQGAHAGLR